MPTDSPDQQPAHLYVHVPFCAGKCPYCAFYSVPYRPDRVRRYLDALRRELRNTQSPAPSTIYLGGGTPTVLDPSELQRLGRLLADRLDLSGLTEWTVEANPAEDLAARIEALLPYGLTRVSVGAQAFDDNTLARLGRRHCTADVRRAVAAVRRHPALKLGIDLIAAVPGMDRGEWARTLEQAVAAEPVHVSVYTLSLEPGTPFAVRAQNGALRLLDDEAQLDALEQAETVLQASGCRAYEISNFARPGHECRHNLAFWRGADYLGLGPAAASRIGRHRLMNRPDLAGYTAALLDGADPPRDLECLAPDQDRAERLAFALRLREGVDPRSLPAGSARFERTLHAACAALADDGLLEGTTPPLRLTARGRRLADHVAARILDCALP